MGQICKIFSLATFTMLFLMRSCDRVEGYSFLFQSGLGEGSHFLTSATIAEALVERGHSVTFLISNACAFQKENPRWNTKFTFEIFNHSYPPEQALDRLKAFVKSSIDDGLAAAARKHYAHVMKGGARDCADLLADHQLMDRLTESKFDAFVADIVWPCSCIIGEKLNTRRIVVNPSGYLPMTAGLFGSPVDLSFTATAMENVPELPMTFLQRVMNLLGFQLQSIFFNRLFSGSYENLMNMHETSLVKSLNGMCSNADLILFNMDFTAENCVSLTPNIITVGGLTAKAAKPLPKELDNFVNESGDEGVIEFSLGTYVNNTNERITRTLIKAFSEIKARVVWKFENRDGVPVSSNVKTMEWLPINDLLGHNKTRLFIFQGGNNGFYESLYHGVPMIVLPILGDQGQIASRVVQRGIGLSLDVRKITSEDLRNAILEVLYSERIRNEVLRLSTIYRDTPMSPLNKATYWIEHVTKFGGNYLRPPSLDIEYSKASLMDVCIFLAMALAIVLFVSYKLLALIIKCICRYIFTRS